MWLITSLSSQQIENLDNDFEENQFFRFDEKYPGHRYACLERLKDSKTPMLYYNDSIPDLELCKVDNSANEEEVDVATQNIRNEYASKMLLLFLPFREREELPLFEDRWDFFLEAYENGYLYWDSPRLMQNIQDVENSKKIVLVDDELTKTTNGLKMGTDLEEEYGNLDISEKEEMCNHSSDYHYPNEINCDLIMEEFGILETDLEKDVYGKNYAGSLNKEMDDIHIITHSVEAGSSVFLVQDDIGPIPNTSLENAVSVPNYTCDVVKLVLNLDKTSEHGNITWSDMVDDPNFNFPRFFYVNEKLYSVLQFGHKTNCSIQRYMFIFHASFLE
jgi:hypothetical protein